MTARACRRIGCTRPASRRSRQVCAACDAELLSAALRSGVHGGRGGTLAEHGTCSRYTRGCACPRCRRAHAAYGRAYRALRNQRHQCGLVDAAAARALVLMLLDDHGWDDLVAAGISRTTLARLRRGDAARIRHSTWRRIHTVAIAFGADRRTAADELVREVA